MPVVTQPIAEAQSGSVSSPPGLSGKEQIVVLLLFLSAIALYVNSLPNGFVYDDRTQILENPYIKSWHYLPQIFRGNVWSFLGPARTSNYYRPFLSLTYLLLWQAFADLPMGYHLLNVLLNALVVVCVYLTGERLFKDRFAATAAGLVFCFHPVHVQAVNWIDAVADVEITLLLLLAFSVYIGDAPLTWRRQALIGLCFVSALLIKETAITLVLLLPFYSLVVREKQTRRGAFHFVRKLLPVSLMAATYVGVRILLLGKFTPVLQRSQIAWREVLFSAFALIGQYARLLVFPRNLSAFHTFHKSAALLEPAAVLGLGVFCVYVALCASLRKRYPEAVFALVWIGVTLLPVLNPRWMAANVLAERYLYLPSVGFAWASGWAISKCWSAVGNLRLWRFPVQIALTAGAIALVFLSASSIWAGSEDWRDEYRLYTAALKSNPDSWDLRLNLGVVYLERGDLPGAERELLRAKELRPDAYYVRNALGCVYLEQGRLDDAEKQFREGLAIQPRWPDLHMNYGRLLTRQGKEGQALDEFRQAVDFAPLNARTHYYLAQALADSGNDVQAEAEFRTSFSLSRDPNTEHGLADLLLKEGRQREAAEWLRRLSARDPYDAKAHLQLARLLETSGQTSAAWKEYQAVLVLDPRNSEASEAAERLGPDHK